MHDVFISYNKENANFVNLLEAILKYSGISVWRDKSELRGGPKIRDVIDDNLARSEKLLVVVSDASSKSDWVPYEIKQYLASGPLKNIVAARLDETDPDRVQVGLSKYKVIDFSKCMLTGFGEVLADFGQ